MNPSPTSEAQNRPSSPWSAWRVLAALLGGTIAGVLAALYMPKPLPELSRTEFLAEVQSGHVHKIAVVDNQVITGESTTRGRFRTAFQKDETALIAELRALGVEVVFEESAPSLI